MTADVSINPWKKRLPLLMILAVAVIGALTLGDFLSYETLRAQRETLIVFRDSHYIATAAVFLIAYVAIVAFSLPGATAATLTGGFLFGLFPGVLFNISAATLGAIVIFLAARWGFGERLAARMDASDGRIRRLKAQLDENQFSVLLMIRLVPAVPFFVANLLPAFVGMRLATFTAATFLGIIPGSIVLTWVGVGLGEVFARGESPDLGLIFEPQILGPMIALAALVALPIVARALRGKKATNKKESIE